MRDQTRAGFIRAATLDSANGLIVSSGHPSAPRPWGYRLNGRANKFTGELEELFLLDKQPERRGCRTTHGSPTP